MGSIQFLLPRREGLAEVAAKCAYMVGNDGTPWETWVSCSDGRLTVTRDARESGRLIMPWAVPGIGSVALSTATLIPRDSPYQLVLELCRGTLARIHSQCTTGLLDEPAVKAALRAAQGHFIRASLQQHDVDQCACEAETSLAICLDLISQCLGHKTRAAAAASPAFSSRLTGFQVRGGAELAQVDRLTPWPGNAVFYQSSWRQAEPNPGQWDWQDWQRGLARVRAARRRVVCGPLFRLEREDLPDWLYLWDDDFDTLQGYLCNYVRIAVEQLQRHVNVWYVTAGTNVDAELHLGEEQRLRLTLSAVESLRHADAQTPAIVGIKQPWGEYLGRSSADLSPLQFADILVRSDLGVSGFALEMQLDSDAGRTLPRDLLELNRLVDLWSQFGLPLVVVVSLPMLAADQQVTALPLRRLQELVTLLQYKPAVQGIIWGELLDRSDWPAGLLQAGGKPKSLWRRVHELWQRPSGAA
jgi:hypothetical protein